MGSPAAVTRQEYRKNTTQTVVAVQLDLDALVMTFEKWGAQQTAKPGDWLIENGTDCYTVEQSSFARTYTKVGPGIYQKTGSVWAEQAVADGVVPTKEGSTAYQAGDYLVANNQDGSDSYAVTKEKFEAMYEPVVPDDGPDAPDAPVEEAAV